MNRLKKKHFPLFTIITITRNNLSGLEKTGASVDRQTFEEHEWIVIDGASKDKTPDFLRKRRSQTRTARYPFTFVSEEDDGIYDAMNIGIEKARGHYIIFMNAGDIFATNNVLEILSEHTEKKPDFIYGDALEPTENPDKRTYKRARRYKDLKWGMITHHQSMIYRRHTIRDHKLRYSLHYEIASDYDFTARFLLKSKKIIYVPKPICIFEQGGISQQKAALGRKEQYLIREKLDIMPVGYNLWIICVQSMTWKLRTAWPGGYKMLRKLITGR